MLVMPKQGRGGRDNRNRARAEQVDPVLPVGAAFGVPLNDGRFGLCRVIGHGGGKPSGYKKFKGEGAGAIRVLATRWVGTQSQLSRASKDPRARRGLVPTFVRHQNTKPYVTWTTHPPPPTFVPAGTLMPTASEQKLASSDMVWAWIASQIAFQFEYEADPKAYVAKRKALLAPKPAPVLPTRQRPRGKPPTLTALARRKPFADWEPAMRTRARRRIEKLVATLIATQRQPSRDLRAIVSCARSFNREREMGTLEAESLDDVLLEIASAAGIAADTYGRAVDAVRDW